MSDLSALDSIVLGIFSIAVVRGVFIGLIREGFSIAALGGGLLAIRYGIEPVASVIRQAAGGVGETASHWMAGAAIGIAVVAVIGVVGKKLRQGAQAVGLALIRAGSTVLYRSIFDAVRDFLHEEAFEGHERVMARYLKPDLLILDDMGMKQLPKRSGE